MVLGGIQYADSIGEFGSPEVGEAIARVGGISADTDASADVSAGSAAHGLPTWLKDMFSDTHLESEEQREQLALVLNRHLVAFKSPDQQLGCTDRVLQGSIQGVLDRFGRRIVECLWPRWP